MKKLINELSNLSIVQELKDRRLTVLLLFLYSEKYTVELCKKNKIKNKHVYICSECGADVGSCPSSLQEKVEELIENKIIGEELKEPLFLLKKIRDRLIHDINPDNEKILNWLKEYKPPVNESIKNLLESRDEWESFLICILAVIANLSEKLLDVDGKVEIIFNEKTKKWFFNFN